MHRRRRGERGSRIGLCIHRLGWNQQPVAPAWQRLDEARLGPVVAERRAHLPHGVGERLVDLDVLLGPQLGAQTVARHQLARALEQ
ncbi:MAG TPA: hypothetical protein VFS60_01950 [Thermoanaerobaculia bacterium]|nr:hypothetical protein [Thermoanaerobaculia bacterium]